MSNNINEHNFLGIDLSDFDGLEDFIPNNSNDLYLNKQNSFMNSTNTISYNSMTNQPATNEQHPLNTNNINNSSLHPYNMAQSKLNTIESYSRRHSVPNIFPSTSIYPSPIHSISTTPPLPQSNIPITSQPLIQFNDICWNPIDSNPNLDTIMELDFLPPTRQRKTFSSDRRMSFSTEPYSTEQRKMSFSVDNSSPIIHRRMSYSIDHTPTSSRLTDCKMSFNESIQDETKSELPMSGLSARRGSMATPQDIQTWQDSRRLTIEGYPIMTLADQEAIQKSKSAIPRKQALRFEGDLYTPQWVRYTGNAKEGYCGSCRKWFQLKNSGFWYHQQFFHGISSVTGQPFRLPLDERKTTDGTTESLCHQCRQYVISRNSKDKNWFRHAHKCHVYDRPRKIKKN